MPNYKFLFKKIGVIAILLLVFANFAHATTPTLATYHAQRREVTQRFMDNIISGQFVRAEKFIDPKYKDRFNLYAWRWVLATSGDYVRSTGTAVFHSKPYHSLEWIAFTKASRMFRIDFDTKLPQISNITMTWNPK